MLIPVLKTMGRGVRSVRGAVIIIILGGFNHPYSQLRAEGRSYNVFEKQACKGTFGYQPHQPIMTTEHSQRSREDYLTYGSGRESNRGHLGERRALYAQANHATLKSECSRQVVLVNRRRQPKEKENSNIKPGQVGLGSSPTCRRKSLSNHGRHGWQPTNSDFISGHEGFTSLPRSEG